MAAADTSRERRYISCADTAKLVRKALKAEFPGRKFSVRSSTYAGGASIHVNWIDGPSEQAVRAVTDLYAGASFDGMIDLQSYHDSFLTGEDGMPELVHFGANFVIPQRSISEEAEGALVAEVEALIGRFEKSERIPVYVDDFGGITLLSGCTEWATDVLYRMSVRRAGDPR
jgi:hypothetical protein